jgi:hypothetical protein
MSSRQDRGTYFPEDFAPTDNNMLNAQRWELNLADMVEAFSDYHQSKGSRFVNWNLALNTWMRNAHERKLPKSNFRPREPVVVPDRRYEEALANYINRPPLRHQ